MILCIIQKKKNNSPNANLIFILYIFCFVVVKTDITEL
jgi:hypothetical protein